MKAKNRLHLFILTNVNKCDISRISSGYIQYPKKIKAISAEKSKNYMIKTIQRS